MKKGQTKKRILTSLISAIALVLILYAVCAVAFKTASPMEILRLTFEENATPSAGGGGFSLEDVPDYRDSPYAVINGNTPFFTEDEMTDTSFERYGALDSLGRCTEAFACVGKDLMPTEKRGDIGSVKPTGWHSVRYENVDGKSLYNRCHLIGYQLSGENANERNLITGTRYLNVTGMLPFENMVADYVSETGNHVMYRVTPIFKESELLARGVLMEARSVEDDDVMFCVFCYNVQPGITLDHATGNSCLEGEALPSGTEGESSYVLNTKTEKFHRPTCSSVEKIDKTNKAVSEKTRDELIAAGYSPCGSCKP